MTENGPATGAIDPMELRKTLGAFVTGVTVVTTRETDGTPRGFTANSFTSVSLDPPLVLVCIGKSALSCDVFCGCENFAINILAEEQTETSATFASKDPDKFARADWRVGAGGSPIIEGTAAWIECVRHDVVEAGDHVILMGRVTDLAHTASNPLGFCRGSYVKFGLERDAVAAPGQQTRVGAILESEGRILMIRDGAKGPYALPTAARLGGPEEAGSLMATFVDLGLEAKITFLFAVYESEAGDEHRVYYRGDIVSGPVDGAPVSLFAFDEIPWDGIADSALRDMLVRYVAERSENRFGIYVGDDERGRIHSLSEDYGGSPGWS